jgi:DUF4097 and DUF4098 domain-containing protein YvlB
MNKLLVGLFALTLGQSATAGNCAERKNIDLSFAASEFIELRINALAGEFFIEAGDSDTISVAAVACSDEIEYLDRIDIDISKDNRILELTVMIPYNDRDWHARYAHVDLTIQVPAELLTMIRDSSGDLEARGITLGRLEDSSGEIRLRNTSGDISLRDSSGDVYIRDHRGNLTLEDSSGDLELSAITGDIWIQRDSSGDIEIDSVSGLVTIDRDSSGDIEIDKIGKSVIVGSDGSGSIRISEVRGSVEIGADGSGNVNVRTVDGDFTVLSKGSGDIRTSDIKGKVRIPN